jgi:hypothetical protein
LLHDPGRSAAPATSAAPADADEEDSEYRHEPANRQELMGRKAEMDLTPYLEHANKAMGVLTVMLVQLLKYFLPSPAKIGLAGIPDKWKVIPQLKWFLPLAAFLIGIALSLLFDPHVGQSFLGKIQDGLETGAYAIVMWELYSRWIQPVISGTPAA